MNWLHDLFCPIDGIFSLANITAGWAILADSWRFWYAKAYDILRRIA